MKSEKTSDLVEFLKNRRSSLSINLEIPGPTKEELESIIKLASRVPDHGKLVPWRFEVWTNDARKELHDFLIEWLSKHNSEEYKKLASQTAKLLHAPCVIAVISKVDKESSIPEWEQVLSSGAVCLNVLLVSNAKGFECQWLTSWFIYKPELRALIGLSENERISGLIYIGTSSILKHDRERPDLTNILLHKKRFNLQT